MATINGTTSSVEWTYKLEASETSYSVSDNTSTVKVTVYIGRSRSRSYIGGDYSSSVTVNGSTQSYNGTIPYPTYINAGAWYELYSKTFTGIKHNNDGSKSVSISSSMSSSVFSPSSCSASGSLTLTKIPRQANITSAPDFNDEANPTINYSNPAGNSVNSLQACISLTGAKDDIPYRDVSKTGSSYTFNLTYAERQTLRKACTTSNKLSVKFYVRTIIGSNTYYSNITKTMTIINANPTSTTVEFLDDNQTTKDLTGTTDVIIKGYSTLKVNIFPDYLPEAKKEAYMVKYTLEDKEAPYSETETVSLSVPNYSKNGFALYSIDSRGNSSISGYDPFPEGWFIDYSDVQKGNITLSRSDNGVGEQLTLAYNGIFWNGDFGAVNNSLTATYRYKKTTSNQWTTGTTTINPTINNNTFNYSGIVAGDTEQHGFSINDSYDFEVVISDKLSTVTFSAILGAGSPAIAVYKNKVALGNKYDTSLGGEVQLWGDVYVNGTKIS